MVVIVLLGLLSLAWEIQADPNPAYVCSFCLVALGLVEESLFQIHLENALAAKCQGNKTCLYAVKQLVLSLEKKVVPEDICREITLCDGQCPLFAQWPVDPLPEQPISWPILRHNAILDSSNTLQQEVERVIPQSILDEDLPRDLRLLKPFFEDLLWSFLPQEWGMWAHVSIGLGELHALLMSKGKQGLVPPTAPSQVAEDPCGWDLKCKFNRLGDHKPLQDYDGDYFSSIYSRRLRGNDWRGVDCNDREESVYPGRRLSTYNVDVDHNCNAIVGGNETIPSFEDLFCKDSQPRGIAILGDSATAHFHIPPQWLTAQGWTMDQLLVDALNEVDQPHCSWGTAHMDSLEECPYQHPIDGNAQTNAIISLYSQLRQRNRCNHNDFQNIGVNGARMPSSMQLVDALARDQKNDNPLLVWLALIGNDICSTHPDFDHMTTPDEFYSKAMETLTQLDTKVPSGSYVVALALFDGELLYQTMHKHTHPVGTTYSAMYDFMNCMEENPCWGWLNSNATVRRISTYKSNQLNDVYQNISDNQSFQNFKFIFYSPHWAEIFEDYTKTGRPLTDLIEPSDGFHPSQTGNAIFAKKFFEYLEENHPEALGPVNPYNAEIDALFFNPQAKSNYMKSMMKQKL